MQEIIKALTAFQKECPKLDLNSEVKVKTKTGGNYSFKYADLPYINEIIQPTLSKNNLSIVFTFEDSLVCLNLFHTSGETIKSSLPLNLTVNPQENGSLITYYRRYLTVSVLNLTADQDDDGNTFNQNDRELTEPTEWLNVNLSKGSKKFNPRFVLAWEAINVNKGSIQDIRKLFKVSKETAVKLEDKTLVAIIKEDEYNATLDGTLDQITTVLKGYAMTKTQRDELDGIVKEALIENEVIKQEQTTK